VQNAAVRSASGCPALGKHVSGIAEGSEDSATSKKLEMDGTD